VCPCCGVGCRLAPRETGTRARGIAGPANPNGRLCAAGINAFTRDDERLTTPLLREDGELAPCSWEQALSYVADRFIAIRDTDGPDALGFLGAPHCTNETNYLLGKLARLLGTNNVDNRSRLCHVATARAAATQFGHPATTNALCDLLDADLIVVAGGNPAERQPIAFNSFIRPAVADGATLVHLDPVGNRTTRLADVHVAPRPGTDALVCDLISAQVLANGSGVDRSFIDNRTRGFDQFVSALGALETARAHETTGVSRAQIHTVADHVAAADRVAWLTGTGIERGETRCRAPAAICNLLLLTGNVGRRGTGLYILRGLTNEQGASDAGCAPDRLPGHQPVTDPAARDRVEAVWGVTPPASPGLPADELLKACGTTIRGALVVGENPAITKRDRAAISRELGGLDTLVVTDIAPTETTQYADVVLPAAAGGEKAGTVTNLERRIQRVQQAMEPPGDAWPDRAILQALGRRLTDEPEAFTHADAAAVFDEFCQVAPTHARLSAGDIGVAGVQWPADDDTGDRLYETTFATPDGLGRFDATRATQTPEAPDGLRLVTGGRNRGAADRSSLDTSVRINPSDATARGITAGDTVVISSGDDTVRATAVLSETTRAGTVYLPATVADPFLRQHTETVSLRRDRPAE